MTNYVYVAASLDNYIATVDGGLDWLNEIPNPDQSDYGFANFMNKVDALVMGRRTFEKVVSFGEWPYDKFVFVLSNTLTQIPEGYEGKVEIVSGDIKLLVNDLKKKGYNNLYIDGGITIQNFLKEDLVDELIITKIPIILGSGIPLFSELKQPLKFQHKKTEIYNDSLIKSTYVRNR